MPAYHTRRNLPVDSSQHQCVLAAAAAQLRASTFQAGLRQQAIVALQQQKQYKQQRNQARLHHAITLPRNPVRVAKRRAAKTKAAQAHGNQKTRGIRWYDGADSTMNGVELAKQRTREAKQRINKQLDIKHRREEALKQEQLKEARDRRVRVNGVINDAKEIVNRNSEEFEKGSFCLLRADGSLHRSIRQSVLKHTFVGIEQVGSSAVAAWVPSGAKSTRQEKLSIVGDATYCWSPKVVARDGEVVIDVL